MKTNTRLIAEMLFIKELITKTYPTGLVSVVSDTFDFWSVISVIAKEIKPIIEGRDGKVVFRPDSGNPVDIICGESYLNAKDLDEADEIAYSMASDYAEECLNDREVCGVNDINYIFKISNKFYKVICKIECIKECTAWSDTDIYTVDEIITKFEEITLLPSQKGSVECLWDIYGGTINEKGYKVLNPKVGLIYGDSITIDIARQILEGLEAKGFASSNIVFGIGSYTYNYSTRDSFGMAVKSTYVEIDGKPFNIEKDPKTGDGVKKSAKGLLCVTQNESGDFILHNECTPEMENTGCLEPVFKNGKLVKFQTLAEIRERLNH